MYTGIAVKNIRLHTGYGSNLIFQVLGQSSLRDTSFCAQAFPCFLSCKLH